MRITTPGQRNALPQSEKPQGLFEEHHNTTPHPPLRLERSTVTDHKTHSPIFTIAPRPNLGRCFPFGKSALGITHTNTNAAIGSFHFSRSTLSHIWLETKGRGKSLRRLLTPSGYPYWEYRLDSIFAWKRKPGYWFWEFDEQVPHAAVLVDGGGSWNVIARIDGNVLSFVRGGLDGDAVDEIVVGAVALAEYTRLVLEHEDVVDVSRSVTDFVDGSHQSYEGGRQRSSGRHGKLKKERPASSRQRRHGANSGEFAFARFAAGGYGGGGGCGAGGGCDGGGGGGGCCS